jgi:hypothetical protein
MSSVLDYYGQYNPESTLDWNGIKSSKFGKTRKYFLPRDSIRSSNYFKNIKVYKCQIIKANLDANIINNISVHKDNFVAH